MSKTLRAVLILLVGTALVVGVLGITLADPGNGKGKGANGPSSNCKKCPPEPQDCTFFECTNHFCNYECVLPDGTIETRTLSKH